MNISNINEIITRNTPAHFAEFLSNGQYKIPKHIELLNSVLLNAFNRKSNRIIINLPPRHGKSELISKYFPFWYLCNLPQSRIILCSYKSTFAQSWGRKVLSLFNEFSEKVGLTIKSNARSTSYFEIEKYGGSMTSVGIDGALTGKGADLIIIDDPIKNAEQANSLVYRDRIWEWYRSTLYTRLEPNGVIILMMTRWHEDDLCGRIIKDIENNGEPWEIIRIPAIAGDDDLLMRNAGEALWPERFDFVKLMRIKKTLGDYWFNSLYQQSPVPSDGGIFKRNHIRYFNKSGNYLQIEGDNNYETIDLGSCNIFISVDLAISLSSNADYTVFVVGAVNYKSDLFVLEVIRKRVEPSEHLEILKKLNHIYKPILIGIENVQYQSALISMAAREGLPIKSIKPDKDKLTRALPLAAKFELGKVFISGHTEWQDCLVSELLAFPKGKHDDQVDALAYLNLMTIRHTSGLPVGF